MHRSEVYDRTRCLDCSTEVSDTRERAFTSEPGTLCFECAVRRGGKYDELHDHWDATPDLAGLNLPADGSPRVWK